MEQTHRLNNFRQWDRLASFASKLLVWVLLFAAIYMLRSFFLLIFLTFVFAYVQASGARRLEPFIKNRMVRVVISAVILLSLIVATGAFLFPRVKDSNESFRITLSGLYRIERCSTL
jgi:predicted PurR-regulated permease PerM